MGGAGWFWKNRGKQRKPLPELSPLIDLTHCNSILYLRRREPCNHYARAFSMDGRFPYYYAPGSFPMGLHDFSCYNPMQARPGLDLAVPSSILASAQNRSISPTSTSSNSSYSPSGSTVESVSDALDFEAMGGDTAQTNKFEEVKQQ